MPIQIDFIADLFAQRLGRRRDDGALRVGDHRRLANFSATLVRFYFALPCTQPARACRGLPLGLSTQPVLPLGLTAVGAALGIVASIDAIDLAMIAVPADVKWSSAIVCYALNLPKIVHPRAPPPGIRPLAETRATRPMSNASPAATQGSELVPPGPFLLAVLVAIVPNLAPKGQLRG